MPSQLLSRAAALAILSASAVAHAGNDDELLLGNQAAMVGGAVTATVKDSSALWYNPAGLGAADRDQIDISATVYTIRSYAVPRIISTTSGAYHNGHVTEFVVVPTQIAYVRRLESGLSIGFGYFSPHAEVYVLREALKDPQGDPPSEWQVGGAGGTTQHIFAAGVGRAFSSKLRLGVSLFGGYATSTDSIFLFGASSNAQGGTEASSSTSVIATTSTFSLQLGVGMQLDLTPELVFGVSLRSPELQLYWQIESFQAVNLGTLQAPSEPRLGATSNDSTDSVTFELLRPGRAGAALGYRYAHGVVTLEVDAQPPLHRPRVSVDRGTVVNARLGWYHTLSPALAIGCGFFTDRAPKTGAYDFVSGAGHFYGATLGVELSNQHSLAPKERTSSLVFKSVFAVRYAYSHGDFGRVVGDPSQLTGALPFATAKGTMTVHELSLYAGGGLHF